MIVVGGDSSEIISKVLKVEGNEGECFWKSNFSL